MARSSGRLVMACLALSIGVVSMGGAANAAWGRSGDAQATGASPSLTSADFSFSLSLGGLSASDVSLTGSGQIDFVNQAVSTSIALPSILSGVLGGGSVNAVISGGVLYLEVPGLGGSSGPSWISLPLPSDSLVGAFNTIATALGNVSQITSFASSHHATVSSLGSSIVDATAVNGYLISVGSSSFALKVTLWANSLDELVQAVIQETGASGGPSLSITFNLSGYNSAVTVTPPPPSQVMTIPLLLAQQFPGGMVSNSKPVKKVVGFADSHLVKRGRHHG